jgi:PIN domain nuclease of toxin-antitoxin system
VDLLDTHALIWSINSPHLLSSTVKRRIENKQVVLSAISFWELLLKKDRPDTPVKDPVLWWQTYVVGKGIDILPVQWFHLLPLANLPPLHKDPFDRILICQALKENLRLITKDKDIRRCANIVSCIW